MTKDTALTKALPDQIARAEANLDRHLGWIERFDTKSSLAFGFALAMLGVLVTVVPPISKWNFGLLISVCLTIALSMSSILFLFKGQYPRVKAPNNSIIFFGTICKLPQNEFEKRHRAMTDNEYLIDLLAQIHVNAIILGKKFLALKIALILMLLSSLPWLVTLYFSQLVAS